MVANLWPFLIYWLVMFVLSYIAVEIGQDQFYDEVTPRAGLKVGLGSLILAAMLTYFHPTFESMFTTNLAWTVLQAIVWAGVFTLIYQFHPPHALAIALPLMLIGSGFATMGVDSVMTPTRPLRPVSASGTSRPVRKSLGPMAPMPTQAPAQPPAAKK
jgi:hypothetical protein